MPASFVCVEGNQKKEKKATDRGVPRGTQPQTSLVFLRQKKHAC